MLKANRAFLSYFFQFRVDTSNCFSDWNVDYTFRLPITLQNGANILTFEFKLIKQMIFWTSAIFVVLSEKQAKFSIDKYLHVIFKYKYNFMFL